MQSLWGQWLRVCHVVCDFLGPGSQSMLPAARSTNKMCRWIPNDSMNNTAFAILVISESDWMPPEVLAGACECWHAEGTFKTRRLWVSSLCNTWEGRITSAHACRYTCFPWFFFLQDDPIRCRAVDKSDVPRQGGDFDGYGKPVLLKNAARTARTVASAWSCASHLASLSWKENAGLSQVAVAPGCCCPCPMAPGDPMGSQWVPRSDEYLMAKYGNTVLDQAWNAWIGRSNSAVVMQSKLCKSKPSGLVLLGGISPS